jgi:D-3-phosphoglycerate dehydrogenase
VAATVFSHNEPRIVDMDGFRVDVKPEGIMLIALSHDEPGFIGRVGTLLGESDINIGGWRTGRDLPGGTQLSFISVDSEVPDDVVDLLAKTPPIERVTRIEL